MSPRTRNQWGEEKKKGEKSRKSKLKDANALIQNRDALENDDFSGFNEVLQKSQR